MTSSNPGAETPAVVARVLEATPIGADDLVIVDYKQASAFELWAIGQPPNTNRATPRWGDPEPIAARQAVAVLRWVLDNSDQVREYYSVWHWLAAVADELAPTDAPTEPLGPRRIPRQDAVAEPFVSKDCTRGHHVLCGGRSSLRGRCQCECHSHDGAIAAHYRTEGDGK